LILSEIVTDGQELLAEFIGTCWKNHFSHQNLADFVCTCISNSIS
jgi:hypothetical protein